MKLGRAVEMSPRVFREQLTSWDRISQAASADSVLLSTWKHNAHIKHLHATKHCSMLKSSLVQYMTSENDIIGFGRKEK